MNLKIDFDSSLKDFEANCQAADAALDDKSNNIVPIIYSGLQLTSCLSFDFDIDLYCELHSTCLIYFANLRKALSDKSRFSKDKLNVAFEISLSCPYVLPRLYLALLIACTTKNKEQLKLISEMLLAVAHPLRGLLLRFTAISFFPKCPELADLLVDFAVTNFKEMLFLLSGFLKNYPKSKQLACQWLTSNTTISLFLSDNNPSIVKSFFDFAKACKENYVSIAIVDSISQSIEGPQIPKYFDLFADFFKTKAREETAKMKRNKILQAKKLGGNAGLNTNQKAAVPPQNQQKNIKPAETPSSQNAPTSNPSQSTTQQNQNSKNPNLQPNRQQSSKSNSSPAQHQQQPQQQQQQQQQQPSVQPQQQQAPKSQIQMNRFQPAAVAMPPMGRVALPPMRTMAGVAMPPISLPQQQQQQKDNQQDQEQPHQNDEAKKDEENQENELENENSHGSAGNLNDGDASSDSSNGEEDLNEEDENEEQNQQNEIKQEIEPKQDGQNQNQTENENQNENETKNANENDNDTENENSKQSNPGTTTIRLMQSLSDSSLVPEIKAANSITTNPAIPSANDSNSTQNVSLQMTSSLSSPSFPVTQHPQQTQQQQKKQKQRRRQKNGNTLYNATKHIAIACLEKCDNAREGFRFIQMTPFSESCGLEVTRLALRMNDIEVVKMCASRWMKHSVLHEILTQLGYKAFAEIIPPELPGGLEITKEFIQKVIENPESESSDSFSLRKILSGELHGRTAELDGYINELIITHINYDESFYRTLFAEPYKFNDFLQISSVVSRYTSSFIPSSTEPSDKETMKKTVLSFLDRTRIDVQNIISLRCGVYENDENGDELVTKSLESIKDSVLNPADYYYNNGTNNIAINNANSSNEVSFDSNLSLLNDKTTSSSLAIFQSKEQVEERASVARRILISHLSRLKISNSSLENLFAHLAAFVAGKGFSPKSSENNEFTGFILLSAIKGNEVLTEKALLLMLDMDLNTSKVSDQINLYFEALNVILSVTENEKENSCLISLDTTKRILDQIVEIIKALDSFKKFFPIMTPVQSNYLLKIADAAKKKKHFSQFQDIFDSIIESLKNC